MRSLLFITFKIVIFIFSIHCQLDPSQLPKLCQDPIISLSFQNLTLYPRSSNLWEEGVNFCGQTVLDAYIYPQQENYTNTVTTSQNNTIAVTNPSIDIPARQGINFQFQLGPSGADPMGTYLITEQQLSLVDIFCQGSNQITQAFNLQSQNMNTLNGTLLFTSSQCNPAVLNETSCDQVENIHISEIQYKNTSGNMPTFNQSFYVGITPSQVMASVFPNNYNLNPSIANVVGYMVQPDFQQSFNNTPILYNHQFQLSQRTGIKVCYGIGDEGCCISSNIIESSINNFKPVDCVEIAFSQLNCNTGNKTFSVTLNGTNHGNFTVTGICSLYQNLANTSIY